MTPMQRLQQACEHRQLSFPREHLITFALLSPATQAHERHEANTLAKTNLARLPHQNFAGRNWRQIVKNRISFRHDRRWGPESATLPHAVY